jgi:hypothetical protein
MNAAPNNSNEFSNMAASLSSLLWTRVNTANYIWGATVIIIVLVFIFCHHHRLF